MPQYGLDSDEGDNKPSSTSTQPSYPVSVNPISLPDWLIKHRTASVSTPPFPVINGQQNPLVCGQTNGQHNIETTFVTTTNSAVGTSTNSDFSNSLQELNVAFCNSVQNAVAQNPSHSLLPMVKDYLYHSRVLLEQYKRGIAEHGDNPPPKTFKSLGEFFDNFESPKPVLTAPAPAETMTGNAFASAPIGSFSLGLNRSQHTSLSTTPSAATTVNQVNSAAAPAPFVPSPVSPFSGFSFLTPGSTTFITTPAVAERPENTASSKNGEEDDKSPQVDVAPPGSKGADESPVGEADDKEHPEEKVAPVVEDDAIYSIRCKVFGVENGNPVVKGIGMLYIKKLEDGRYQVIVRADNSVGTVILNILLQKSIPLQMNGKNAIMTVDPQANNQKGMPIIIRVKTEADASELLQKLQEFTM